MKWRIEQPSRPVLLAPVIVAITYYGLFWVWFVWLMCNLVRVRGEAAPVLDNNEYFWATGFNLFLIGWLVVAHVQAWKRPDGLQKSHLVGTGLGILLLLAMQFGLQRLAGPNAFGPAEPQSLIEAWQETRERGKNPLLYPVWD